MTIQVNEKYVLTEEELNLRKAMDFLKGCGVGYAIEKGVKYNSTKEPREDFLKGVKYSHYASKGWVTICHIIHNRLRHDRPHTSSYESDQKYLTDFREDRWGNHRHIEDFKVALEEYGVSIPGLED